jgi:hypothetical protein
MEVGPGDPSDKVYVEARVQAWYLLVPLVGYALHPLAYIDAGPSHDLDEWGVKCRTPLTVLQPEEPPRGDMMVQGAGANFILLKILLNKRRMV